VALAVTLFAILLLVSAVVIWQHASRDHQGEITFGINDAVDFILNRLEPQVAARLGRSGIQRIVEWEIFYLQGLAQRNRSTSVVTVAGDYEPAVEYISAEIQQRHGVTYSRADVSAVLDEQVAYLASIGAIGDMAGGEDQ
jgi:hypothetical protein